jgi:hypothetical protein
MNNRSFNHRRGADFAGCVVKSSAPSYLNKTKHAKDDDDVTTPRLANQRKPIEEANCAQPRSASRQSLRHQRKEENVFLAHQKAGKSVVFFKTTFPPSFHGPPFSLSMCPDTLFD